MKYIKKLLKIIFIIILIIVSILLVDYIRIQIFYRINNFKEVQTIEGYTDNYIPQAITYSDKYKVILQTSYNKKHKVSMLYVLDSTTGKTIKKLKILKPDNSENTNHVGGIANNEETVWITSDYEIEEYSLEEIINTNNDYIKSTKIDKLYNRGDYCTYKDNMLWIGDFYLYPIYKVPNNNPLLLGYKLDDNLDYNKPEYAINMPIMVQGITIDNNNNFIITQSYTNLINSRLKRYSNVTKTNTTETIKINNYDVKYYKFDNTNIMNNIVIPPMAEGIFYKEDSVYILFENSANKYFFADPKIKKLIKYYLN